MKNEMKKFLATFLAVALAAVACCVFASAEDTNIALGKSYTTIGIYLLETETQPIYIDEEGKTLTDGVKATAGLAYRDPLWVGFNMNSPDAKDNEGVCEIEIDLGGDAKVSGFAVEVYLPEKAGGGISAPSKVEFFYSADGEEWTSAGEGALTENGSQSVVALDLDAAVDAKYVKAELVPTGWLFISEIEVMGTMGAGTTDESKSETESKTESEAVSSAAPVESSAAATSSTASSTPSTSDAGIFAVVVLAVVAVIGAAVVVKKRA